MPAVLIVGATRGLGASLAKLYAARPDCTVFGTSRSSTAPTDFTAKVEWITNIDLMQESCGNNLVNQLGKQGVGAGMVNAIEGFDTVVITAGYFATEDFKSGPKWDEQVKMYTTSSIAPTVLIHSLHVAGLLHRDTKIILVSSESGSITLRHEKEGGGNYGHHASKAALNMVGALLSIDLKEEGIIVGIAHPGFMRTEMTAGVGFDKYWDEGGAVTSDEAAESLVEHIDGLSIANTGEFWAPRGPKDIGTSEETIGPKEEGKPLQLPW